MNATRVLVLTVMVLLCVAPAAPGRDDGETVAALRDAYDTFLDQSSFVGHFESWNGSAGSLEGAVAGRFRTDTVDGVADVRTGLIVKEGPRMRLRAIPALPPVALGGGRIRGPVPFDQSAAGDVAVTYFLKVDAGRGETLNQLIAGLREGVPGRTAGRKSGSLLTPITFGGGAKLVNPFDLDLHGTASVRDESVRTEHDRIVVARTYRFSDDQGMFVKQETTWRTDFDRPVLVRIRSEDHTGPPKYRPIVSVRVAEDLVEIGGLMVARTVRSAVAHPQHRGTVRVEEWRSPDLGDRPPNDEDFAVPLDDDARILGLANPPTGADRRLNPVRMTTDDLSLGVHATPTFHVVERNLAAQGPDWSAWLLIVTAVAGLAAATLWVKRRWA